MKNVSRLEEIIRDAVKAKERFRGYVEAVRKDMTRTQQGRAQLMNEEWTKVSRKLASLRDEYQQEIANQRASLERSAFANGDRDYHVTVEKVTEMDSKQRQRALEMAEKTRNPNMLRALAAIAHQEKNWPVLEHIAQFDKGVRDLISFEQEHGTLRQLNDKFGLNVALSAPAKPEEVQRNAHVTYIPG